MNRFATFARWLMVVVLIWGSLIGCGQQSQEKIPAWIQVHFTPDKTIVSPVQPVVLTVKIDGLETLKTATLMIRPSGIVSTTLPVRQKITAADIVNGSLEFPITAVMTGTGTGLLVVALRLDSTTETRDLWEWRLDQDQYSGGEGVFFLVTDDRVSIARDPSVAYIDDIAYQYDHGIITDQERSGLLRKYRGGGGITVVTSTTTPPSITPTLK
jgi:hypothetical protein